MGDNVVKTFNLFDAMAAEEQGAALASPNKFHTWCIQHLGLAPDTKNKSTNLYNLLSHRNIHPALQAWCQNISLHVDLQPSKWLEITTSHNVSLITNLVNGYTKDMSSIFGKKLTAGIPSSTLTTIRSTIASDLTKEGELNPTKTQRRQGDKAKGGALFYPTQPDTKELSGLPALKADDIKALKNQNRS